MPRQQELASQLSEKAGALQELGTELKAMEGNPHLAKPYKALEKQADELASAVTGLRREQSQNSALQDSLNDRVAWLKTGQEDAPAPTSATWLCQWQRRRPASTV